MRMILEAIAHVRLFMFSSFLVSHVILVCCCFVVVVAVVFVVVLFFGRGLNVLFVFFGCGLDNVNI